MSEIDMNEIRSRLAGERWGENQSRRDIAALLDAFDEVRAERDAYRKAKQENDERFQLEAGTQRERAEKAEAAIERVRKYFGLDSSETCANLTPEERDSDCIECQIASVLDGVS